MNWDRIEGNSWSMLKSVVRKQWDRLTDEELDEIAGDRERLVGKVQERYDIPRDEAERQVREWEEGPRLPPDEPEAA
jgi:uncharacterized protein YjbJ (UPF0337 family)